MNRHAAAVLAAASCLALLVACRAPDGPPDEAVRDAHVETGLAGSGFCAISDWGPQRVYAGERFNERDDGGSAFWFRTDCAPERVMLAIDDRLIETSRNPPTITASLNADGYLQQPGEYTLHFHDPATGRRLEIGTFRVLPARQPVNLPPAPPSDWPRVAASLPPPRLVAHAGGGVRGRRYLNSREALDHNYALGHRLFELDFAWTRDDELVAIHDWDASWHRLFPDAATDVPPTHAEFLEARMQDDQTQLDLARLDAWLAEHPDAWIVTDIRGRDVYGLQKIRAALGEHLRQVVPQLYHPHRYDDIRALGYEQVIFTLYATSLDTGSLLDFARTAPLYAVTVNPQRKDAHRIIAGLAAAGVPVYVHTFNGTGDPARFQAQGAHGLYTDFLYPGPDGAVLLQ